MSGLKTGDSVYMVVLFIDIPENEELNVMPLAFSEEELAREAIEEAERDLGDTLVDWTLLTYALNHPLYKREEHILH